MWCSETVGYKFNTLAKEGTVAERANLLVV